jgi:hypothetical protein
MKLFDYVNSITNNKVSYARVMEDVEGFESNYDPFIINRALSYFIDTIMQSNDMNMYHQLDSDVQYAYLLNSIRKRKRFSKWSTRCDDSKTEVIADYYGYSKREAKLFVDLIDDAAISEMKQALQKDSAS